MHPRYERIPWTVLHCPWIFWPLQLQSTMMNTLSDLAIKKSPLKLHSNGLKILLRRDKLIKDWGRTRHRKNNGKRRIILVEVKIEISSGYLLLRIVMLRVIIQTLSLVKRISFLELHMNLNSCIECRKLKNRNWKSWFIIEWYTFLIVLVFVRGSTASVIAGSLYYLHHKRDYERSTERFWLKGAFED